MILQCVLVVQKIFPTRYDAKLGRERSFQNSPAARSEKTRLASSLVENIFRTPRTHSNATLHHFYFVLTLSNSIHSFFEGFEV